MATFVAQMPKHCSVNLVCGLLFDKPQGGISLEHIEGDDTIQESCGDKGCAGFWVAALIF